MIRSVYVHIPFCEKICSYCDFCKMFYNEKLVEQYLEELEKEVDADKLFEDVILFVTSHLNDCQVEKKIVGNSYTAIFYLKKKEV